MKRKVKIFSTARIFLLGLFFGEAYLFFCSQPINANDVVYQRCTDVFEKIEPDFEKTFFNEMEEFVVNFTEKNSEAFSGPGWEMKEGDSIGIYLVDDSGRKWPFGGARLLKKENVIHGIMPLGFYNSLGFGLYDPIDWAFDPTISPLELGTFLLLKDIIADIIGLDRKIIIHGPHYPLYGYSYRLLYITYKGEVLCQEPFKIKKPTCTIMARWCENEEGEITLCELIENFTGAPRLLIESSGAKRGWKDTRMKVVVQVNTPGGIEEYSRNNGPWKEPYDGSEEKETKWGDFKDDTPKLNRNYRIEVRDKKKSGSDKDPVYCALDLGSKPWSDTTPVRSSPFLTPGPEGYGIQLGLEFCGSRFSPVENCSKQEDAGKDYCQCRACFDKGAIWTAIGCLPSNLSGLISDFLFKLGFSISGGIAFLLLLYGGIVVLTSRGEAERINQGKEIITSAITGLLLVIFSILILRLITVNILQVPGWEGGSISTSPTPRPTVVHPPGTRPTVVHPPGRRR